MSQDSDLAFEGVVAETLDLALTPTQAMSRLSSGCSSATSMPGRSPKDADSSSTYLCNICRKSYKTLQGYQKHLFLHKVQDYNDRKPDIELASAVVDELVVSILEEIKNEPNCSPDKLAVISDVIAAQGSSNWVWFLQDLSDPILNALTKRTKLLPSSQYEEFLCKFNKFLNNKELYFDLKEKFMVLLTDDTLKQSSSVTLILSRICNRLPEDVMVFITHEMAKRKNKETTADTVINDEQFSSQISSVIRLYFTKAAQMKSEVWKVRSNCIRTKFIVSKNDACNSPLEIVKKTNWQEKNLIPSENFVQFCTGVEKLIKDQIASKQGIELDDIVFVLLGPQHSSIVNTWSYLTNCYLEDEDSIVFMRDFVSIFLRHPLRLEEQCVKGQVEERKRLQKFGIRDNLKRN